MIKRRKATFTKGNTTNLVPFSILTIILFARFLFHSNKGFKFAMKLLLSGFHTSTKKCTVKYFKSLGIFIAKTHDFLNSSNDSNEWQYMNVWIYNKRFNKRYSWIHGSSMGNRNERHSIQYSIKLESLAFQIKLRSIIY